MNRLTLRIVCAVLLCCSAAAVAQTEFSADLVQDRKSGQTPTKLYMGKDKMRFDGAGDARSGGGSVIFDFASDSWTVLMDQQHMYMQMPSKMMENRGMFHFFKTGDVENACSEWLKLARNQGGTCHKAGSESVNGRDTVKYEGTNAQGEKSSVWLDSKLRFPVKWEDKNGGGEMRNIKEGAQPSSLFEIPAGYKQFDMGQMMQQHQ